MKHSGPLDAFFNIFVPQVSVCAFTQGTPQFALFILGTPQKLVKDGSFS